MSPSITLSPEVANSDPGTMGGKLCFTGTRVPVRSLFDFLEGGDSIDDFKESFPRVRHDQIVGILEYAASALALETAEQPIAA